MRVLIIEDNQAFASLIAEYFGKSGIDSDRVDSVAAAERALSGMNYAAIILDLGLPDRDGLEFLQELRARGNATPVIVTTARHGLEDRVRGLREGADDYVTKPFSIDELIARLHAVLRRPSRLLGQTLRVGNVSLDTETHQVNIGAEVQGVRLREALVLEHLMRHTGEVVKRDFLIDQLFGLDGTQDSGAIDVYVHRLRRQLMDGNATVTIHTIRGVGYMLTGTKPARSSAGGPLCA